MNIGHFSDIHGRVGPIDAAEPVDVWVSSGDFLPDPAWPVDTRQGVERFQTRWLADHAAEIEARLNGRPLLYVGGNHDFVDIGPTLIRAGVHALSLALHAVTIGGHVFAGFREVMPLNGWGVSETYEFDAVIKRAFDANPTILVTHAPPYGVLDAGYGVPALTTAFRDRTHRIQAHLFGHIHEHGGEKQVVGAVTHYNAATKCVVVHV